MAEPTHWAIEVDGFAAGGIGVTLGEGTYIKSAEFGYWLGEPYWGRGIMTEAVRLVVPHVMSRFDLIRLESPVFEWNPARCACLSSVVLFGKACLEPVGSRTGKLLIGLSMPLLAERPANRPIEPDLRKRASPASSAAHGRR